MMHLCFRRFTTNIAIILLVLGSLEGFPHWPTEGEKSVLPFVLDIPSEDLKLYSDVNTLLKNAMIEYREALEIEDNPKSHIDINGYIARLKGDKFSKRSSLTSLSEPKGDDSELWDDTVDKQYETFSYGDDDLIVNKKRSDLSRICEKGNVFGSWLNKLCIESG